MKIEYILRADKNFRQYGTTQRSTVQNNAVYSAVQNSIAWHGTAKF